MTAIVSWTPLTESRGIITDYTIFYSELNSTEEAQLNTSMSDLTGYKTATVSGKESNALIHAIVERTPCAFVLVASTRIGLGPASEPVFSQGAALCKWLLHSICVQNCLSSLVDSSAQHSRCYINSLKTTLIAYHQVVECQYHISQCIVLAVAPSHYTTSYLYLLVLDTNYR